MARRLSVEPRPEVNALGREWSRGPQWSSEAARRAWESPLQRAADVWSELELLSVPAVRPAALVEVDAVDLPAAAASAIRTGLRATPVALAGGRLRVAFHEAGREVDWAEAWGNDERVGELLGFPPCCRQHFARTWSAGRRDTVLTQERHDGPPEANVWLRQLGVRLVPHLPCSSDCAESAEIGRRISAAGHAAGLGEEVDVLLALLRLPVRYTASSGVAIAETPHFRLMAGTTETGATSRAGEDVQPPPPAPWEDNSFATRAAMAAAHAPLLRAIGPVDSALDLGAGDGSLLAELARSGGRGPWFGVEVDNGRVFRGLCRHPGLTLVVDRIESFPDRPQVDAVLIAAPRLHEMAAEAAAAVCHQVRLCGRRLVLYAYGDWKSELVATIKTYGLADVWQFGPAASAGSVRVAIGERKD